MNWAAIRLDVDLSPVLCQAIILTNVFSANTYQETDFNAKHIEINKFSLDKLLLNLSSYFAAILSRGVWVDIWVIVSKSLQELQCHKGSLHNTKSCVVHRSAWVDPFYLGLVVTVTWWVSTITHRERHFLSFYVQLFLWIKTMKTETIPEKLMNSIALTHLPLEMMFSVAFCDWKILYFDWNFTEIRSQEPNWK